MLERSHDRRSRLLLYTAAASEQAAAVHGASPSFTWNTPKRRFDIVSESTCFQRTMVLGNQDATPLPFPPTGADDGA